MSEASLQRVLDRDGMYWGYPGDDSDDPGLPRWVELRVDAELALVGAAREELESAGWVLASQPDDPSETTQRLYFRKFQALTEMDREAMLLAGYKAAVASNGRFWSWINLDDEQSS